MTTTTPDRSPACVLAQPKIHAISTRSIEAAVARLPSMYCQRPIVLHSTDALSTGLAAFDSALGIGGLPRGRIVELFGSEASGKTTLALHAALQAQRAGGHVVYIDSDCRLDRCYVNRIGVSIEQLVTYRPETAEQAFDLTACVLSIGVDLVVIDSLAALIPRREFEGDASFVDADLAGLISRSLRKWAFLAARQNACVLILNQIRNKSDVLFGNPSTTPGGRALRHHASVRAELSRIQSRGCNSVPAPERFRVTVVKSCIAPRSSAEFELI